MLLMLMVMACCLGGISPQEAEEKWGLVSKLKEEIVLQEGGKNGVRS